MPLERHVQALGEQVNVLATIDVGEMWDRHLGEFLGEWSRLDRQGLSAAQMDAEMQAFMDGLSSKPLERVSRENAELMERRMSRDDILVIHDPQPLGMGALLKRELGIPTIFRCHIGLDEDLPQTRAAWEFLRPFAEACDFSVFSALEYVPEFLAGRACIIHPAIDPVSFNFDNDEFERMDELFKKCVRDVLDIDVTPDPEDEEK